MKTTIFFLLYLLWSSSSFAQLEGGGVPVKLTGIASSPLTYNSSIYVGTSRLVVTKHYNWFKEDKEIGISLNCTFFGRDQEAEKSIHYTSIFTTDVADYGSGRASLPINVPFVRDLRISSDQVSYSSMIIAPTILRTNKPTGFGQLVKKLIEISKQLPYPPPGSPFSAPIQLLSDLATEVLSPSQDNQNGVSERAPLAHLGLNFRPRTAPESFKCDSTGGYAVVFGVKDSDKDKEGVMDISRRDNYILTIKNVNGVDMLYLQKKIATGWSQPVELYNNHLLFYVIAYPIQTAPVVSERIEKLNLNKKNLEGLHKNKNFSSLSEKDKKVTSVGETIIIKEKGGRNATIIPEHQADNAAIIESALIFSSLGIDLQFLPIPEFIQERSRINK